MMWAFNHDESSRSFAKAVQLDPGCAIVQALRKHDFNRTETARALGISRRALIYKLQRFRELGYEVDAPKGEA